MRKLILFVLIVTAAAWFSFGCAGGRQSKRPTVVVPGGTVAATLGFGFDVYYDSELDNVVPGYKILTVGYTNNSMNIVQMDPLHDRWLLVDRRGKKIIGITDLRNVDPDVWAGLPKRLRKIIEYPLLIPIGKTEAIDILFKEDINLGEFKSVIYEAAKQDKNVKILPRED